MVFFEKTSDVTQKRLTYFPDCVVKLFEQLVEGGVCLGSGVHLASGQVHVANQLLHQLLPA